MRLHVQVGATNARHPPGRIVRRVEADVPGEERMRQRFPDSTSAYLPTTYAGTSPTESTIAQAG